MCSFYAVSTCGAAVLNHKLMTVKVLPSFQPEIPAAGGVSDDAAGRELGEKQKAHVSFKETRHKGCDIPVRLPGSFKAVTFIYNPAAFKDAVTIHGNRAFTHTRAHTVTHVWFLTLVNTQLCSSCHMSLWCGYVCVSVCVVWFFFMTEALPWHQRTVKSHKSNVCVNAACTLGDVPVKQKLWHLRNFACGLGFFFFCTPPNNLMNTSLTVLAPWHSLKQRDGILWLISASTWTCAFNMCQLGKSRTTKDL